MYPFFHSLKGTHPSPFPQPRISAFPQHPAPRVGFTYILLTIFAYLVMCLFPQ